MEGNLSDGWPTAVILDGLDRAIQELGKSTINEGSFIFSERQQPRSYVTTHSSRRRSYEKYKKTPRVMMEFNPLNDTAHIVVERFPS